MRRTKVNGKFEKVNIPQPLSVPDYDQFMNGVDRFDQTLACLNISRKCYSWWKIFFFHLVDIADVNSFLIFQKYRVEHADVEGLQRRNSYSIIDFRKASVRQTCGRPEFDDPPAYKRAHLGGLLRKLFSKDGVVVTCKCDNEKPKNKALTVINHIKRKHQEANGQITLDLDDFKVAFP